MTTFKRNGYKLDIRPAGDLPEQANRALFIGFSDTPIAIGSKPGTPGAVLLFTDNQTAWMAHRDLVLPHAECFDQRITPDTTMRASELTTEQRDSITYACIITRGK